VTQVFEDRVAAEIKNLAPDTYDEKVSSVFDGISVLAKGGSTDTAGVLGKALGTVMDTTLQLVKAFRDSEVNTNLAIQHDLDKRFESTISQVDDEMRKQLDAYYEGLAADEAIVEISELVSTSINVNCMYTYGTLMKDVHSSGVWGAVNSYQYNVVDDSMEPYLTLISESFPSSGMEFFMLDNVFPGVTQTANVQAGQTNGFYLRDMVVDSDNGSVKGTLWCWSNGFYDGNTYAFGEKEACSIGFSSTSTPNIIPMTVSVPFAQSFTDAAGTTISSYNLGEVTVPESIVNTAAATDHATVSVPGYVPIVIGMGMTPERVPVTTSAGNYAQTAFPIAHTGRYYYPADVGRAAASPDVSWSPPKLSAWWVVGSVVFDLAALAASFYLPSVLAPALELVGEAGSAGRLVMQLYKETQVAWEVYSQTMSLMQIATQMRQVLSKTSSITRKQMSVTGDSSGVMQISLFNKSYNSYDAVWSQKGTAVSSTQTWSSEANVLNKEISSLGGEVQQSYIDWRQTPTTTPISQTAAVRQQYLTGVTDSLGTTSYVLTNLPTVRISPLDGWTGGTMSNFGFNLRRSSGWNTSTHKFNFSLVGYIVAKGPSTGSLVGTAMTKWTYNFTTTPPASAPATTVGVVTEVPKDCLDTLISNRGEGATGAILM
jgi:putative lipoic acid-binding regulatory protein